MIVINYLICLNVHEMNNDNEQEIKYKILRLLDKDPNLTQRQMAKEIGLSLGKFNYCLKEIAPARILEDIDESNRLKLPGTPTIFLNGRNISDTFQSPNQIRRLIDAMIEDAQ